MQNPPSREPNVVRLGGECSIQLSYGCRKTKILRFPIIEETGEKVNSLQGTNPLGEKSGDYFVPKDTPIARAERTACASCGTNLVLPATSASGLCPTVLPIIATACP